MLSRRDASGHCLDSRRRAIGCGPKDRVLTAEQFLDAQPITMPSPAILQVSLDLSGRYSLSHWDSLLLAACLEAGIDTLYTEDLDAGMTYDTGSVINPFS